MLRIEVSDNGCGIPEEKLKRLQEENVEISKEDRAHIGICGVKKRLNILYGNRAGMEIRSTEEGTAVLIWLPVKRLGGN